MEAEGEKLELDFDPAGRVLCPDGGCIGVIGADGNCKVCGTPAPEGTDLSAVRRAETEGGVSPPGADDDADDDNLGSFDGPAMNDAAESIGDFETERRLCPDGGCIGLIGDDGRCKVCGRAGDGAA